MGSVIGHKRKRRRGNKRRKKKKRRELMDPLAPVFIYTCCVNKACQAPSQPIGGKGGGKKKKKKKKKKGSFISFIQ